MRFLVSLTKVDKKGKERKGNLISLVRLSPSPYSHTRDMGYGLIYKEGRSRRTWISGTTAGSSMSGI